MIPSPLKDKPYDDRETDCLIALEMRVHDVVDEAEAAGWARLEAMAAIASIALNQMFAEQEKEVTNSRLAEAQGKVALKASDSFPR